MADKVFNVLFLCTGNSARSIFAEVLMNHAGGGRFRADSAGSHPEGEVNPLTLETLQGMRAPIEGLRSKSWDDFAAPDAPRFDFVFTVCDAAAAETCPVWPGQPMTAHWGVPDPAASTGTDDARRRAFKDAAISLKRRVDLLMDLPLPTLDRLAIQRAIQEVGRS